MNKKAIKAVNLLSFLIFSLVAIVSVVLTVIFIKPPATQSKQEKTETSEVVKVAEDKHESYEGELLGNLMQHYEGDSNYGLAASNNKYVFKYAVINDKKCLIRTDMKTSDVEILITGYKAKNLNIIKNNLYMILEQYGENKEVYEVIAHLNIKDNTINTLNTTKSSTITSYMSDGKYIYYTTADAYDILRVDEDGGVQVMYTTRKSAEKPILIGINDGKLYYVNGSEMCTLGINSHTNKVISTQYCSIEQSPIMTNIGIICFQKLSRDRLDLIDYDGNHVKTLIKESQMKKFPSGIKSINYSCGYIFLSTDSNIYYLDKKDDYSIKKFDDARPKTNQIYLTDEYMILDNSKYGSPEIYKIVWLVAS